MARIRTIKPELWQDEKLSPLAPLTRLVFIGLISMSDDQGRLVDNIKSIDGFLFPETKDSSREPLDILARIGRVIRYTSASGQKLIQITNWARHQKVDKPGKYSLPGPMAEVDTGQQLTEPSRDSSETLDNSSRSDLRPSTSDPRSTTPTLVLADAEHVSDPFEEEFSHVWLIYPKRDGGNSKKEAIKAYRARRRIGVEHQTLLEGTRRYAAYCQAKGWIRTSFVKQAATFYGPDEHYLETWEVGESPPTNGKLSAGEITKMRIEAMVARGEG